MRKAIIIASEVRSGSTYIAECIAYHFNKLIGDVLFDLTKEHFANVDALSSHVDILQRFNSLYLGEKGWVATKIMCAALSVIVREARKEKALREAFFGPSTYWVVVRRRQKVRQAVSLAYARKTGLWHLYSDQEEEAKDIPLISVGDTEDALRAILLSDTYLETFSNFLASDRKIDVYYEDFLGNPTELVERLYAVLGVNRPHEDRKFVDETKLKRQAIDIKLESERAFRCWHLENYHDWEKVQFPSTIPPSLPPTVAGEQEGDIRSKIVKDFLRGRVSMRALAKEHGVDRSLISYWVAKFKHGELDVEDSHIHRHESLENKILRLEHQLSELRKQCNASSVMDSKIDGGAK